MQLTGMPSVGGVPWYMSCELVINVISYIPIWYVANVHHLLLYILENKTRSQ